jgi:hypothetical protein
MQARFRKSSQNDENVICLGLANEQGLEAKDRGREGCDQNSDENEYAQTIRSMLAG